MQGNGDIYVEQFGDEFARAQKGDHGLSYHLTVSHLAIDPESSVHQQTLTCVQPSIVYSPEFPLIEQ